VDARTEWVHDAPPIQRRVVTFCCTHPRRPDTGISLQLREETKPGGGDPDLERKADAVAASLEFLDAP